MYGIQACTVVPHICAVLEVCSFAAAACVPASAAFYARFEVMPPRSALEGRLPCALVSDNGYVHVVETNQECLHVSQKHGLRNDYTRRVIAEKQPAHNGWQRLLDAQWLQHADSGVLVAVSGGASNFGAQYEEILRRCNLPARTPPHDRRAQQFFAGVAWCPSNLHRPFCARATPDECTRPSPSTPRPLSAGNGGSARLPVDRLAVRAVCSDPAVRTDGDGNQSIDLAH